MHNTNRRSAVRVALACLVIAGGTFAVPGLASSGEEHATASSAVARSAAPVGVAPATPEGAGAFDAAGWTQAALGGVSADVFTLALNAAQAAVARGEAQASTLTVIDFSLPSTAERLWVFDLRTRALLFKELVSHGRNSGHDMATAFSNEAESHKSSLGLFRTAEGYVGKHGYSLRLDGLERGVNDRARARAIVIHGAEYVNGAAAKAQGRLGRSLGCPAVRPAVSRRLIDAVKGGGLLFAYYPDPTWLRTSAYLN
jgi:hypothetical protein